MDAPELGKRFVSRRACGCACGLGCGIVAGGQILSHLRNVPFLCACGSISYFLPGLLFPSPFLGNCASIRNCKQDTHVKQYEISETK